MPAKGASPDTISSLRTTIPEIFDSAQRSSTGLRKHAVSLRKIQEQCFDFDRVEFTGEDAFNKELIRNLNKVLPVKKREASAERIVKLIATFVQVSSEKDTKKTADEVFDNTDDDTVSARFVELLIRYLLQGFVAADKSTRMRSCQIVAMCVTCLGEIDEELYFELVKSVTQRTRDKESAIRVHAAIALSKLQSGEDAENGEVTNILINLMQHDPSAEVRRAVLLNIEKNQATIPFVMERARDSDATNRKCVFLKVMPSIDYHVLSIEERERLLSAGVNDRDANVKRACVRMIGESWLTFAEQNLLELTGALDVVDSPAASKVMQALFALYPEIPENLKFDQDLWDNLTPEMAFIIRSTAEFFSARADYERVDEHVPDAMKLVVLLEAVGARLEAEMDEEIRPEYEFIIHQLLLIAKISDFPDELGRREMLNLMRRMLLVPEIPENNIEAIADIIRKVAVSEQDFIRIMVEVVSDVRETPQAEMAEEDAKLEALLVSIKCLIITKHIMQRSFEPLNEGSSVYGLLTEFVVPAVQSSESVLQEYGIECLALCCLLDKSLAVDNAQLFAQAIKQGGGDLHAKGLSALLDLAFMYGLKGIAASLGGNDEFLEMMYTELESDDVKMQATAAEGLAKLLYAHRILEPEGVLEELLILYYHPATTNNSALRQCLTYFFPAFSYMGRENQEAVGKVAVNVICRLGRVFSSVQTPPGQIAQQLVAWADPRIFEAISAMSTSAPVRTTVRLDVYSGIAMDALKRSFGTSSRVRKVLVQMLNKLALDEKTPLVRVQELFVLTSTLQQRGIVTDMITRNALARFEAQMVKLLGVETAEEVGLEAWKEEAEMAGVFEFVETLAENNGNDESEDDKESDEENDTDKVLRRSKRIKDRSMRVDEPMSGDTLSSDIEDTDGIASMMPVPKESPMRRARDNRLEQLNREIDELLESEEEGDDGDEDYYVDN